MLQAKVYDVCLQRRGETDRAFMEFKVVEVAVERLSLYGEGGSESLCPALLDKLDVERLIRTVDFITYYSVLKVFGVHTDLMLAACLWFYAA